MKSVKCSFPEIKRPGTEADHSPSSNEVKNGKGKVQHFAGTETLYRLPDDGDYTETCCSCFYVNFNTPFKVILLCIGW